MFYREYQVPVLAPYYIAIVNGETVEFTGVKIFVVLRRILWEELWDFVLEPTDNDGGILEMDDEPPRSISDAGIKDLLRLQYGINNVMDV